MIAAMLKYKCESQEISDLDLDAFVELDDLFIFSYCPHVESTPVSHIQPPKLWTEILPTAHMMDEIMMKPVPPI
jgi:hypothetical protein